MAEESNVENHILYKDKKSKKKKKRTVDLISAAQNFLGDNILQKTFFVLLSYIAWELGV